MKTNQKKNNKKSNVVTKVSDTYRKVEESPFGLAYDLANAGLYIAAPFTGGATLIPAMAMTGVQALGATADVVDKGLTLNNGLDIASAVPGFGLSEKVVKAVMPGVMKSVGKSTKIVKYAPKYLTSKESKIFTVPVRRSVGHHGGRTVTRTIDTNFELGKTRSPLWLLAKENPAYRPYASIVYGEDALNHGLNLLQVGNDLKDNKK